MDRIAVLHHAANCRSGVDSCGPTMFYDIGDDDSEQKNTIDKTSNAVLGYLPSILSSALLFDCSDGVDVQFPASTDPLDIEETSTSSQSNSG